MKFPSIISLIYRKLAFAFTITLPNLYLTVIDWLYILVISFNIEHCKNKSVYSKSQYNRKQLGTSQKYPKIHSVVEHSRSWVERQKSYKYQPFNNLLEHTKHRCCPTIIKVLIKLPKIIGRHSGYCLLVTVLVPHQSLRCQMTFSRLSHFIFCARYIFLLEINFVPIILIPT